MNGLKRLIITTLTLTPSGALSPGPLSASAVAAGALLGPLGGFLVALGHTLVELPYVVILHRFTGLWRGALDWLRIPMNAVIVGFLLFFSQGLLRDAVAILNGGGSPRGFAISGPLEALLVGITLTGLNAYFLAWWLTVGHPLIEESARLGLRGLVAMYGSHVWMDYAWLTLLAAGGGATRILGAIPYAALLGILATVLAGFALTIALDTVKLVKGELTARRTRPPRR